MRHFFAALAVALPIAACSDGSGPSNVIPEELAGFWVAQPACLFACGFTFVPVANPADSINIVSFAALTMELELSRSGQFRLQARPGGIPPTTGRARIEGSLLIVRNGTDTDTIDYSVTQTHLTVTFRRIYTLYDFDGDEVNDSMTVRGVFAR